MWLLVIQVIAIIAASMRGWGAKPIVIFVLVFVFSFIAGAVAGPDVISFLQVVDYILIGVFIVMAIIGNEKEHLKSESHFTSQHIIDSYCSNCGNPLAIDQNFCHKCGKAIRK